MLTFSLMDLTDNKGNLTLGSDSEITVSAEENRSTGYAWEIFENTCDIKLKETAEMFTKSGHVVVGAGAPSQRIWTFKTLPGAANYVRGETCEVVFVYKRPWLKTEDSPKDRKTMFVTIN